MVNALRSSGSGRISRQLGSNMGPKPVPGGRQKSLGTFVPVTALPAAWAVASGVLSVRPLPASKTGAALAWACASGAAMVTVLAPKLLGVSAVTVTGSASTVSVSPTRIHVMSLTRRLVAPAVAAAPSVVRVVGVPTVWIVAGSPSTLMAALSVNAATVLTFRFVAPAAVAAVSVAAAFTQQASSAAPSAYVSRRSMRCGPAIQSPFQSAARRYALSNHDGAPQASSFALTLK